MPLQKRVYLLPEDTHPLPMDDPQIPDPLFLTGFNVGQYDGLHFRGLERVKVENTIDGHFLWILVFIAIHA
jgi:hypothetical protein